MKGTLKCWGLLTSVALVALGLWRVRFDAEVLNLLPDRIPAVQGLKLYQKHFASIRELILTVRARDAAAAERAAGQLATRLRAQTNLVADVVWQPPWLELPEQMGEFVAYLWLNSSPTAFAQFTNRLAPDNWNALLQEARDQLGTSLSPSDIARLSYDPFGFTRLPKTGAGHEEMFSGSQEGFASSDAAYRALFLEAAGELSDYRTCAAWMEDIQATVKEVRDAPDWPGEVTVRYTGSPAFTSEIASGMEQDMKRSIWITQVFILVLFWWTHRSWRPLLLLLVTLTVVVISALAAGGLLLERLNAVSMGFAAILLGLSVDYGLIIYQESVAAPQLAASELRRLIAPSVLWSAVTTAAAFSLLNLGGLPGLSQLGSLVAVGILLAALLMLWAFLPLVLRRGGRARRTVCPAAADPTAGAGNPSLASARLVTVVAAGGAVALLLWRWPSVDQSANPLHPRENPAQVALDELQVELNRESDPWLLLVSGRDEAEVAQRLETVREHFARAPVSNTVHSVLLPTLLWPRPDWQQANLPAAVHLTQQAGAMRTAALQAGFTEDALGLSDNVMRYWQSVGTITNALWPTNASARWLLKRAVAWTGQDWLTVGAVHLNTNHVADATLAKLDPARPGIWLTAWSQLGAAVLQMVEHRLWCVMAAMGALVGLCLWLAFRRWHEVVLSFAALVFGLTALLAVMAVAGWSWNLMNLMAVPLLLGAGVDYTIHVQLALRRHGGNATAMRRVTGRAILLCAATTATGFGSTALSGNAGLASLGLICSAGIMIVCVTAVFLLPAWWVVLCPHSAVQDTNSAPPIGNGPRRSEGGPGSPPSAFYRVGLWHVGMAVVRLLPAWLVKGFCLAIAEVHFRTRRQRREVVVRNMLPPLAGDREAAERTAHRLYRRFAVKLAELWGMESGVPVRNWVTAPAELEIIRTACARGHGVLFVTLHLGNWEHGGLLLNELGIPLTVLTLAEPDDRLTQLRVASRARWGIGTIVIGESNFAFVEVIKQLQAGTAMALSLDRPPRRSAKEVALFGRPFGASLAAAELARASGCALIGVTIVRTPAGYAVKVLPEFTYDRQALGNREARRQLTQQILRAFEPEIQHHLDQWYQFVPIWPEGD